MGVYANKLWDLIHSELILENTAVTSER